MARTPNAPGPIEVAVLLGSAHVEMALACLGSLGAYSLEPLGLRVHDDGSLTAGDRERLEERLGEVRFVSRAEADDRLAAVLARRPALARFRAANPLGLKLIDAPLLADSGELFYCDSDVLFLRPFRGLFRWPSPAAGAVFMRDVQNAYSVRSWHFLLHRRLRLPARVNTGIVSFRADRYDLELVEWYLSRHGFQLAPVWAEQTCWALLGERAGCWAVDPGQVALAGQAAPGDPVGLHFVSPARHLLPARLAGAPDRRGEPPEAIRFLPVSRLRAWGLARTELLRRWRR